MKYILPLLVILTSIIGSLANIYINSDDWYSGLIKSPLNPPSYVFGIVWPILYAIMAFVSFKIAEKISTLFIMQLIFNAAWSWLFFRFQMPLISLIDIYLLIALNLYITTLMYKENKLAFILFIPYVLWISFASYLNLFIVINN